MSTNDSYNANFEHICDIPQIEKKRVADLLDKDGKWVGLALRQMGYEAEDVESIRRCTSRSGQSPAEQLLVRWGNLNHTITELFVVLSREKIFPAMEVIKRFVAPKYHILLKMAEQPDDTPKLMNRPVVNPSPPEATQDDNAEIVRQRRRPTQQLAVPAPLIPPLQVPSGLPTFKFEDLRAATNNWDQARELGRGGFGVVYWGLFKNTNVAIKKIKGITTESARAELRQSFNELKYLNTCRHENVVQLIGCSMDLAGEPCVVYQFMPGGALDTKLFPKKDSIKPLSMGDRVKIAIGTARGLQYLHTFAEKPIIHGDIKPGNILLDSTNEPKIGDFGLTRELAVRDSAMEVSRVYGTRPYIPTEFITQRQLSVKVDSYSFGLVLYEMVTGQRVYMEKRKPQHLKDLVMQAALNGQPIQQLMDRFLPASDVNVISCFELLKVGKFCTEDNPERRFDMVMAYQTLVNVFHGQR